MSILLLAQYGLWLWRVQRGMKLKPVHLVLLFVGQLERNGRIVMDTIDTLSLMRTPTALRPLLGQTVLVVEDSRFASETVRMMCLRSGARRRRADN
ncbi:MAG: hypothetical protein ACJAZ1_003018 [Yoonia sp.]|jgi:hypothetical protein